MRAILAFDTSGAHCAAAILWPNAPRAPLAHGESMAKGQAERLLPMIEQMLARAELRWADLGALGVGTGPGNFTGIRISVALARGLALGLQIPAIGVTGFQARAHGHKGTFNVTIPAPRGQVYAQGFGPERPAALLDSPPDDAPILPLEGMDPADLALAIAQVAALGAGHTPQPRPAPFYLRAADAAPPSDPPPVILP